MLEDFLEKYLNIHTKTLVKELGNIAALRNFSKGDSLITAGKRPEEVFLLIDGIVRKYFIDEDGNDFTDCFLFEAGETVGGCGRGNAASRLSAEALSEVAALSLPVREVRSLMKKYPELVRIQNRRLTASLEKHLEYGIMRRTMKAGERYLWFCGRYPFLLENIPHRYIASFLLMTPQTLSRERAKLREREIYILKKHEEQ